MKNELQAENTHKTTPMPEKMSPRAQKLAVKLSQVTDPELLTKYGLESQNNISRAAEEATKEISGREVGEIGDQLGQLMVAIKSPIDEGQSNSLLAKIFHKAKKEALTVRAKYQNVGATINSISDSLQGSAAKLSDDNETLHKLFDDNKKYYADLDDYINAGLAQLHELDTKTIPAKVKAVDSATGKDQQLESQELSQLQGFRDRLSQRVYSLQLSQQLALQQIAQVNLIARNNNAVRDKIMDAVQNAVPMWKGQVASRLAMLDQQRASENLKLASETSKQLILDNAKIVHQGSIEVAKQSQEAFIDEDTLAQAQESLVASIQDYQQIMLEGQKKRDDATARLQAQTKKMRDQITNASRRNIDAEVNDVRPKELDDPFAVDDEGDNTDGDR